MPETIKELITVEDEAQHLTEFVKRKLDTLTRYLKPLTQEQAINLIKTYGLKDAKTQLIRMDNYRKIRDSKSIYHTCVKWFDMDIASGRRKAFTQPRPETVTSPAINTLDKVAIGAIVNIRGKEFQKETSNHLRSLDNGSLLPIATAANLL